MREENKARQSLQEAKRLEAGARQAEAAAQKREAEVNCKDVEVKHPVMSLTKHDEFGESTGSETFIPGFPSIEVYPPLLRHAIVTAGFRLWRLSTTHFRQLTYTRPS